MIYAPAIPASFWGSLILMSLAGHSMVEALCEAGLTVLLLGVAFNIFAPSLQGYVHLVPLLYVGCRYAARFIQ